MMQMAKKRKSTGKEQKPVQNEALPYVIAFVVCERILVEADNITSAIRIIDTITIGVDQTPPVGESAAFTLSMLLILKAGDARGERTLNVRVVTPERPPVTHPVTNWTFTFNDPDESGQNMRIAPLYLIWAGDGLYYFEVVVGGTVLARTPIRVKLVQAAPEAVQLGPQQ
jgi:hypothetical protein